MPDERLLLIIEDAHWLDSASWTLVRLVSREVQPLLLVVATRPVSDPLPAEYKRLLEAPDTQRLTLAALPLKDALTLVCNRLGVAALPRPVSNLILERAEGHPFFSEELAYALRDADLIEINNGECHLAPGAGDLSSLKFPNTIEGVITSRIDQLEPQHQLAMKVASVIGRVFAFRTLRDIHPIEADKPLLLDYLTALERLDLTPLETPEPDLAYIFKHIITQEVAYNLMAFAQRRQLHQAVAEWLEHTYADDLSPFYPLLAHHWSRVVEVGEAISDQVATAIDYLEKAGEQALGNYANREAIGFFSEALTLDARLEARSDRLRRARWERQLGEAYFGVGRLTESREYLERAAALLGWPIPATRVRLAASLMEQVLLQVLHRMWPARFVGRSQAVSPTLETVRAYELLGHIHYYNNETWPCVNAIVRMLNLAEAVGFSPELARAYAMYSAAAGVIPLYSLAEAYSHRAWETAQDVDHFHTLGFVLIATSLYRIGVGQWSKASEALEQAVEIADRLGDRRQWGESLSGLAIRAYYQGEFMLGAKLWGDIYTGARRSGNVLHEAWGLEGQGENVLRLGRIDEAMHFLDAGVTLLAEHGDLATQIQASGALALAHLRQGQQQLARQMAGMVAQWIAQSSPTAIYSFEGYADVAEVYLALWETSAAGGRSTAERKVLAKAARQACKALHGFARVFPIGQPRSWLWQGLYDWLAGKPRKAHKAWRKSLAHAQRLDMPYEEGLVHYEIGRHLAAGDPKREEHLNRAVEIFTRLEAAYDLSRAQEELKKG